MARIAKWRRDTYWRWQDDRQKRHGGSGVIPGVISAAKGAFIIVGYDTTLRVARTPLAAAAGSFAITGVAATLTYSGSGGSFPDNSTSANEFLILFI